MKKIGRLIQKVLIAIIALLILGTIVILIYPKIADKTEIEDKVVAFLTEHAPAGGESENTGTEVGASGDSSDTDVDGASGNDLVTDPYLPAEEAEVALKSDSLTQTWSDEDKKALKTAYNTVLHKMGLPSDNLLFYEMKEYDGDEYYAFQVVDDFGDAYEDLLYYDADENEVFWHDKKGNLDHAYSTDPIFSGIVPGNEEVAYEDDAWKEVLEGYMTAILTDRNMEKASTYVDSSCYYLASLSEMQRDDFVDATLENQEFLIEQGDSLEERKKSKKIDSYTWNYEIYDTDEYIDEYDMDWVEAYIALDLDTKAHGREDHYGDYYCVYLREYEYGWRVAAFTKIE